MDIRELLEFMVRQNISDIHFKAHCAPLIRLHGHLITTKHEAFSPDLVKTLAYGLMDERLKKTFEDEGELDMAYSLEKVGRFRVNVYRQKGTIALSLRVIPLELKSFEQLHLPAATLQKLCATPSGLILMAGVTGAGKTTTLNAMVHYLNENFAYNIITIEDPIEFYHTDKKSSISQREVGSDTQSFSAALKHILRQDPDVIVIGEMRDPEAIAAAVTAAETGHLVLSTIHTSDATQTIQRIVDAYPSDQHPRIQSALANVLRGVIAQKLVPAVNGESRLPCLELMVVNSYIRQLVGEGKHAELANVMARGHTDGMGTFDQDLLRLFKEGQISKETALVEAARPDNLLSMAQGISVHI